MSILRYPPGKIVNGEDLFNGKGLLKISNKEIGSIRGNDISMIFQEPMTPLNPVLTIGFQVGEVLMLYQKLSEEARGSI